MSEQPTGGSDFFHNKTDKKQPDHYVYQPSASSRPQVFRREEADKLFGEWDDPFVEDNRLLWSEKMEQAEMPNLHEIRKERQEVPLDDNLEQAAAEYAATLQKLAGTPPVLDLVHLGLGSDGHTASLVPGDLVLDVTDVDVAMCGEYQGRPRMTLTYPLLNRAREILWLVTGASKTEMLRRLRDGDPTIPAGRICQDFALVLADEAAAATIISNAVPVSVSLQS